MNVLTSLDQLVGKTIKHINIDDSYESNLFILTEDKAVMLLTFEPWMNDGIACVKSSPVMDELDLFMEAEPELFRYSVISDEEAEVYQRQIFEQSRIEAEETIKRNREKDYQEYLRLKKKFEVDYKL